MSMLPGLSASMGAVCTAVWTLASLRVTSALSLRTQTWHYDADDSDMLDESRFMDIPIMKMVTVSAPTTFRLSEGGHISERRNLGRAIQKGSARSEDIVSYGTRYRSEIAERQMIYHMHVSKTCGTTMCHGAYDNKCWRKNFDTPEFVAWTSCSYTEDGDGWPYSGPQWGHAWSKYHKRPIEVDNCEGLAQYFAERNVTYEGNEAYVISEGLCPQFWNTIIMRNPMNRLFSHMSMYYKGGSSPQWDPAHITPDDVFEQIPWLANNYYIRVLLGDAVYTLPLGSINETHLEMAKKVVDQFDVVLTKKKSLNAEISLALGWQMPEIHERAGHTDEYVANLTAHWSDGQMDTLLEMNALDMKLKKYFDQLYALDQLVFEHPEFSRPSLPSCKCGHLCK